MKRIRTSIMILIVMVISALKADAATYFVNGSQPDNTGDGLSWTTAKKDLQAAINAAGNNDYILIKAGTYKPTMDINGNTSPSDPRTKVFYINKPLTIYGGFLGTEADQYASNPIGNPTILSGDLNGNDVITNPTSAQLFAISNNGENCYRVMIVSGTNSSQCELSGVSVTGANNNGSAGFSFNGNFFDGANGAGFSAINSTISLNKCNIFGNESANDGGGVYLKQSTADINSCQVYNNLAQYGAGIYTREKTTDQSFFIDQSDINTNRAVSKGGGIYSESWMVFWQSSLTNNYAGNSSVIGFGGGIYTTGQNAFISIINALVAKNTVANTYGNGGGICVEGLKNNAVKIINATITGNNSTLFVAGVALLSMIDDGFNCFVRNSIIRFNNNSGFEYSGDFPKTSIAYTCINVTYNGTNGPFSDGGNISTDPLYYNPSSIKGPDGMIGTSDDGYALQYSSPCKNTGSNVYESAGISDVISGDRLIDGTVDMGAYEYNSCFTAAPTGSTTQTLCVGSTVAALSLSGTNIRWYATTNARNSLDPSVALSNGVTYFAAQYINHCVNAARKVVIVSFLAPTPMPTGATTQYLCNGTMLSDIVVSGSNIKYYDDPTYPYDLPSTDPIYNGAIFYITQTVNGCESPRLAVQVFTSVPMPGATPQNLCSSSTVANLNATGTDLKWYSSYGSTTPLPGTTPLTDNTYYYVSQTINGCESPKYVSFVTLFSTAPPIVSSPQTFCIGATVSNLVATGSSIKWYDASTSGNLLPGTTALVNSNIYYASQTVNACESERVPVTASVSTILPAAPTAAAQVFCAGATVLNLVANGSNLKWYDVAVNGTVLNSNVLLVSQDYYVSQMVGNCESPRTQVSVTINTTPAPLIGTQGSCLIYLSDLSASGTAIQWYAAATGGSPLLPSTLLSTATYYASQTINTCESQRTPLSVTPTVLAPIASAQIFCTTLSTVADLLASGTSVLWYSVPSGGIALANNIMLSSGTYYATSTINNCESPRTAVAVDISTAPSISYNSVPATVCSGSGLSPLIPVNTGGNIGSNLYSISPSLPSGMIFNTTNGQLSGYPSISSPTTTYTVSVQNTCGQSATTVTFATGAPTLPVVSAQQFCIATVVSDLVASGASIQWFADASGGAALSSNISVSTNTYYVTSTSNNCESPRVPVSIQVSSLPVIAYNGVPSAICSGTSMTPLLPVNTGGSVAGSTYTITPTLPAGMNFNTSTGAISGSPTVSVSTNTYTVSVQNYCGPASTTLTFTTGVPIAPVASSQQFCSATTVANLIASGTAIQWYANSTGGSALASNTSVTSGTYYVTSTINTCESSRLPVSIQVSSLPVIAYNSVPSAICSGTSMTPLLPSNTGGSVAGSTYTITPALPSGLSFNSSTGGISGSPTVNVSSMTYTVSVQNYCGPATTALTITTGVTIAPLVSIQEFCNSATVSNLVASGTSIQWYANASGGSVLTSGTNVATGTYYVTSTVNTCESPRIPVSVDVSSAPNISYGPITTSICASSPITPLLPSNTGGPITAISYMVSTFAGSTLGSLDGQGTAAQFYYPGGMAKDASGNIYVADYWNDRIRKIDPNGLVSTVCGSTIGFQDGSLAVAKFNRPSDLVVDALGNIYVCDAGNNKIRKISTNGQVSTLAGVSFGYQDGPVATAKFNTPFNIAIDNSGNLYVSDYWNYKIRKISTSGQVSTLAGSTQGYADGIGTAALFDHPTGLCVDAIGNVYVADAYNARIRKITPAGVVTTLAGNSTAGIADGQGTSAQFNFVTNLFMEPSGNILVSDYTRIRRISPSGYVSTLAGFPFLSGSGMIDGNVSVAKFYGVAGILSDATGTIYVADQFNHRIRKLQPITVPGVPVYNINPQLPAGMSFNTATGEISGSPANSVAATTYTISIQNRCGQGSATVPFSAVYTISAAVSANGSISPSGILKICEGNSTTYTITPIANYGISSVVVDGVSVGNSSTYTFSNVTANHTISATFYLLCSNSFNTITQAICQGNSYTFFGNTYTATGVYTHTMVNGNATGCDSIVTLNLTVNINSASTTNLTICSHQLPFAWNGLTFTVAGTQTAHLTNSVGCDSAATLNLSVTPTTIASTVNITACGSYTWNGNTYTNSGSYLSVISGCTVNLLNLTITHELLLSAKVFLDGPYNTTTGMMHDSLRVKGLIPLTEPYSGSPFNKLVLNESAGETVNSAVLAVSGPNAIVDWVFIELRSATNPAVVLSTKRALVQRDGDIVSCVDGVSPVPFTSTPIGNYYVSIKHRNHLGIQSLNAISFNPCIPAVIDFTNSNNVFSLTGQPINSNYPPRKLVGSTYLLWSGDCKRNKNVKYNGLSNDKDEIANAIGLNTLNATINNVYRSEDCNLDGKIRYNNADNDRVIILNNIGINNLNYFINQHTSN